MAGRKGYRPESRRTREVDARVLAHIAQWGGEKPVDMDARVWSNSLARLARKGQVTYERGWRITKR